jgi:hypothetical protein
MNWYMLFFFFGGMCGFVVAIILMRIAIQFESEGEA